MELKDILGLLIEFASLIVSIIALCFSIKAKDIANKAINNMNSNNRNIKNNIDRNNNNSGVIIGENNIGK